MASLTGARVVLLSVMQVLFILHLLLLVVSSTSSKDEGPSTCTAVVRNRSAHITCFFHENVNDTKKSVTIEQRALLPTGEISPDSKAVVSCFWLEHGQWECDVKKGFSEDGSVSTTLKVKIPKPTKEDEGEYVCLLVPSEAQAEPCVLTLAMLPNAKPMPPYNLTIEDTTNDSITVSWVAGESEFLPQVFRVRYRNTAAVGSPYKFEEVYSNNTIYTITDMRSNTEYEISVMAKNSKGVSGYQKNSVFGKTEGSSSNQSECGSSDPNGYLAPFIVVLVLLVCFLCLFAVFFIYSKCTDNGGNPQTTEANNAPDPQAMLPLNALNAPQN